MTWAQPQRGTGRPEHPESPARRKMVSWCALTRKELTVNTTKALAPSDAAEPRPAAAGDPSITAQRGSAAEVARQPPGRRRPWRWLLLALLIVGGLAAAAWYVFVRQGEEETYLELQGNIDVRQVNLSFKVDGRIETLAVDEGDTVKAGQVVATLDKRYFEDELRVARALRDNLAANLAKLEHGSRPEEIAEARAQTAAKEATLAQAKADYARYKELEKTPGAVSKQDLDRYAAQLAVAEADAKYAHESQRLVEIGPRIEDIDAARALLAQEKASIIQIERKLADSNLVAPNDGFILTRSREIGAIVQAGETVFTLTLASPVWVRTYVNERDLGLVRPGMPASGHERHGPGPALLRPCRLHLPDRRIHSQDGRDARDPHQPRLPAARGRRQPRRRPAAGHAGHGEDASATSRGA